MLKTNIIFLFFFTYFVVSCNNNSRETLNIDNTKPIIENSKEEIVKNNNIKLNDINLTKSKKELSITSSNKIEIYLKKDIKEKLNFNSNESLDKEIFYDNKLLKIENNGTVKIQEFTLNETKDQLKEYKPPLTQKILNEPEIKAEENKAVIAALELFSKSKNEKNK